MISGARTRPKPASMNAEHGGLSAGGVLRPEYIHSHTFTDARVFHVEVGLDIRRNIRQFRSSGLRIDAQGGAEGQD